MEDARKVSAKFGNVTFVPPPRTINDVLKQFGPGNYRKPPCSNKGNGPLAEKRFVEFVENYPPDQIGMFRRTHLFADEAQKEFYKGNYPLSIRHIKRSIRQVPANLDTSRYESQLAVFLAYAGDFEAAETALSGARSSYSRIKNWKGSAENRQKVEYHINEVSAALSQSRGDLGEAENYYRVALSIADKVMFDGEERKDYTKLALAKNLTAQGKALEAENLVREVLSTYENLNTAQVVGMVRFGEIMYRQGRFSDAEKAAEIAVKLFKEICAQPENLTLASARDLRAKSLLALGKWKEAVTVYDALRQGLAADMESFTRIYESNLERAISLLRVGRVDEAFKGIELAYNQALERFGENNQETAEAKGFLAMAHLSRGDRGKAIAGFKEAVGTLQALHIQGEAISDDQRTKFIIQAYLKALIDPANRSVAQALAVDPVSETFRLSGFSSSRVVQQAITSSVARSQINDPNLADLVRREQDTEKRVTSLHNGLLDEERKAVKNRDRIESLRDSLKELRAAQRTLSAEIEDQFPEYRALTNPKPLTVQDVQRYLKPDESLISYSLGSNVGLVWAIPKSGNPSFSTIDLAPAEISAMVDELRTALDPVGVSSLGDVPDYDVSKSYDLYGKILGSVSAGWKDAKSLLVVPQGPLSRLPFSLLPTRQTTLGKDKGVLFEKYRNVAWLARTHGITVLPSVTSLAALRSGKRIEAKRRPFVGFGDPFFNARQARAADKDLAVKVASASGQTRGASFKLRSKPATRGTDSAQLGLLPRLPDTRPEINAIAEIMGAEPSRDVFLGRAASEKNVKSLNLSQYKVISFATHGLVSGDLNGLNQPALALSSPQVAQDLNNDGLLTMGEVLWLNINADWVVLSACNTAAGEGKESEAISGLGRAFFYAGARSLLVSNWPVHSGATTALMTTLFNKQTTDKPLERTEALRLTRIDMIDNLVAKTGTGKAVFSYAHPIFWAPFIIVGEGSS